MKKSILAIAVAATMAAPAAVMAAPTVYGNIHLSINAADNDDVGADNNIKMSSNTSTIGVKGSEDLGDGLKAIYKAEFEINIADDPTTHPDEGEFKTSGSGGLSGRDQFVGLKGGWGTVKLGTMSSNYKQMGGKVDPLYRTPLEGRAFLDTQSGDLHGGRGVNRGRQTDTVQYVSPKMAGISLVANVTLSGATDVAGNGAEQNEETTGVGVRWSNKAFLVYVDWIDGMPVTANVNNTGTGSESAFKVGGKFSAKAFSVALQYENAQDLTARDYIFAAGTWNINKNNALILTAGQADFDEPANQASADSTGVAVAYNHKMSKMTNVYVGYGAMSSDVDNNDESMFTLGLRKKF